MKLSFRAQAYLVLASLIFLADTFKGFLYSFPIFTPAVFLIWLKVNIVAIATKWLAVSGLGFAFSLSPKTILIVGCTLGAMITIITLPRFKLVFFLDDMLNRIIGKKAKKPS